MMLQKQDMSFVCHIQTSVSDNGTRTYEHKSSKIANYFYKGSKFQHVREIIRMSNGGIGNANYQIHTGGQSD